jgi:flagellar biosynthesis chaperone FliJ
VTKAKKKVDSASRVLRKARREAQALAKREERHAKRRARGRPSASPNREERHAKRRAWGRPSHTPKPKKKKKSPP